MFNLSWCIMKWIKITEKNRPKIGEKVAFMTNHIMFPDNCYFGIRHEDGYYTSYKKFENADVTHYFYIELPKNNKSILKELIRLIPCYGLISSLIEYDLIYLKNPTFIFYQIISTLIILGKIFSIFLK